MLNTYQFIKYNSDSTFESIIKKGESGAVICLDLEDSISDWINESKTDNLKKEYRNIINRILTGFNNEPSKIKIAIRINSINSGNQKQDIESIPTNSFIHSLLIPKVENNFEIDDVVGQLKLRNITFHEIIPLIETKNGISNLYEIIKSNYQVKKVGFGHCDFNLSINAFPFFHQNTSEYWKYVNKIISILKPFQIKFINSAFLNLNDSLFFDSMLSHLQFIYGDNFGQFTMTHQQTIQCLSFSKKANTLEGKIDNRLILKVNKDSLCTLIKKFESANNGKGFTLTSENYILSPHEYRSAKHHLTNLKEKNIQITYVGGCFPVQGDILFEDIFHQKLKKYIENSSDVNFNVNIIRYERFSNCLQKIADSLEIKNDFLIFHIRPEPFLRIVKFYYKFLNYENKKRISFNFPFLGIINPEKFDLLILSRRYSYGIYSKKSEFYNFFININYFFGCLIGNHKYALRKYLELVKNVVTYCEKEKIKIIILGSARRSQTSFETFLSGILEKYMSKKLSNQKINYVYGFDEHTKNGKKYFNNNGIHATELYHELIAERLYEVIKKDIS